MAVDADLVKGLKQAKGKKMFFAFVPKGPSDGKLLISKAKIKAGDIAAAKKEIGGGAPILGKCMGPISEMVFMTAKPAPGTLANCLKIVTKRDAGLPVIATFQLANEAELEEPENENESEETSAPEARSAVPAAPPAPPAPVDSSVAGIQKALTKLGYAPGAADGVSGPETRAAITKFQQDQGLPADGIAGPKTQAALAKALKGANAGNDAASGGDGGAGNADSGAVVGTPPSDQIVSPRDAASGQSTGKRITDDAADAGQDIDLPRWTAARNNAINGLKALAAKVAATKHGDAAGVVKEIASIISRLPAVPKRNEIDRLKQLIATDDAITAAEQSPKHFHDLVIRQPLLDSLDMLRS